MTRELRRLALCVGLVVTAEIAWAADSDFALDPKITVLSTMLANVRGTGEWGFNALIETDAGDYCSIPASSNRRSGTPVERSASICGAYAMSC